MRVQDAKKSYKRFIMNLHTISHEVTEFLYSDLSSGYRKVTLLSSLFNLISKYIFITLLVASNIIFLSLIFSKNIEMERIDLKNSINMIGLYYEIILVILIFMLESASKRVPLEYLLEGPSTFWLINMKEKYVRADVSKSVVEHELNVLTVDNYLSNMNSIIYSLSSIFIFFMFLINILLIKIYIKIYFLLFFSFIISLPIIINIIWLMNYPAMDIYGVIRERTLRVRKRYELFFSIITLFFVLSFIIHSNIYLYIMDFNIMIVTVFIFAYMFVVYYGLKILRFKRNVVGYLGAFMLVYNHFIFYLIYFIFALYKGYVTLGSMWEDLIALFSLFLLDSSLFMYLGSLSIIPMYGRYRGQRLISFLRSYANYIFNELVGERKGGEKWRELLAELAFVLHFQVESELLVGCVFGRYVDRHIVMDNKLYFIGNDIVGYVLTEPSIDGVALFINYSAVTVLRAELTYALDRILLDVDCVSRLSNKAENVSVVVSSLLRAFNQSLVISRHVSSRRLRRMIVIVRTYMYSLYGYAVRHVGYGDLMYCYKCPVHYTFGRAPITLPKNEINDISNIIRKYLVPALLITRPQAYENIVASGRSETDDC